MRITGAITSITNLMMKTFSSVSLVAADNGGSTMASIIEFAGKVIAAIGQLLYGVTKWVMYFVDILFFYIQQIAGLNMDTSSLNKMVSQESDMVFNFLLSNSTMISQIVRGLIGMAIILIIVFSIIAIIKSQYEALQSGKAASVTDVLKKSMKAIVLMIITPLIAILGIVASNLLLKSLYEATDVSNAASLSTQVFSVASNSANRYRQYASAGQRIPITYDFTKQEEIIEYYRENGATTKMREYLTSDANTIYMTYLMFCDEEFDTFIELNDSTKLDAYHQVYDKSLLAGSDNPLSSYARIRAYNEEYYVVADAIDYAISTSAILHVVTIEDIMQDIVELPSPINEDVFNSFVGTFGIQFFDESDLSTPLLDGGFNNMFNVYLGSTWDVVRWTGTYFSADEEGEPVGRRQIQYNHVRGTINEVDGAVFLLAGEKTEVYNGTEITYSYPLTKGYHEEGSKPFNCEYIERNKMVAMKGIFNSDGHPTAIKRTADGKEVVFYRDTLQEITLGESGNIINTEYVPEEDDGGVLSGIVNFFKKLFNPASWLPKINFSSEEIMITYTKVTIQTGKLAGGEVHFGYLFSDALTSAISGNIYGLKLFTLFNPLNLNYIVLVMGAFLLSKICFLAVFALIKRAYDLMLIIMIYPATCATMPIDNGGGYKQWMNAYTGKLFLTYGLLLGINFVLMLFPVIDSIQFFKAEDIVTNVAAARFSKVIAAVGLSINGQVRLLNLLMAILFELVAFSFLDTNKSGSPGIYDMVIKIVNPNSKDSLYAGNPGAMMMKTVADAGQMIGYAVAAVHALGGVFNLLTAKGQKNLANKIKQKMPGSALLREAEEKSHIKEMKETVKQNVDDTIVLGKMAAQAYEGDYEGAGMTAVQHMDTIERTQQGLVGQANRAKGTQVGIQRRRLAASQQRGKKLKAGNKAAAAGNPQKK